MLQKDCGDIESGLGLKHDKQIIQDSACLESI
jgi:hypothetical protein